LNSNKVQAPECLVPDLDLLHELEIRGFQKATYCWHGALHDQRVTRMQLHPAVRRHSFSLADDADDGDILALGPVELVKRQSDSCRLWRDHHLGEIFLTKFLLQGLHLGFRQKPSSDHKEISSTTHENRGGNWGEIEETNSLAGSLAEEFAYNDITARA